MFGYEFNKDELKRFKKNSKYLGWILLLYVFPIWIIAFILGRYAGGRWMLLFLALVAVGTIFASLLKKKEPR